MIHASLFRFNSSARLLACAVCALVAWSVWARAGTIPALQHPMPVLGMVVLILLGAGRRCAPESAIPRCERRRLWRQCARVLVFLTGPVFLALLTVQWWNAGRYPYFHPFEMRWMFTPPARAWLPGAVNRADAAEMLRWFFPAWTIMVAFQSSRHARLLARAVAWFLIVNAGILSIFGIVQLLSGTTRMFWTSPMSAFFFASFGYANHAASYFALHAGLAAGMLIHALQRRMDGNAGTVRSSSASSVYASLACTVLCLAGAVLSSSRTGIVFAVLLAGFSALWAAFVLWPRMSIPQRFNAAVVTVICMAMLFFMTAAAGGPRLAGDAGDLVRADVPRFLETRLFFADAAVQAWRESPWFGVGGWGFRYFMPIHARQNERAMHLGYANVHNDALQFLCEFGAVGLVLLLVAIAAYLFPLLKAFLKRPKSGLPPVIAGLGAVVLHSLFDLPFRSPGIMLAWLAVAGVASHYFWSADRDFI